MNSFILVIFRLISLNILDKQSCPLQKVIILSSFPIFMSSIIFTSAIGLTSISRTIGTRVDTEYHPNVGRLGSEACSDSGHVAQLQIKENGLG